MSLIENVLKKAGYKKGTDLSIDDSYATVGAPWWESSGEEEGKGRKKAVFTHAFWLAPPFGRPRDIDYEKLEPLEKSVWVRICIQHVVDSIASAEFNIVPSKKGEEVPAQLLEDAITFFDSVIWEESWSRMLRMMLPDLMQYDAGVIIKSYSALDYGEDSRLDIKKDKDGIYKSRPLELYARDGKSFLKDTDLFGKLKNYWQYSWINPQGKPIRFLPEEIIYMQQNPQSASPYGLSNLEIIDDIINYMMDSTLAQSKYWDNGLFIGGQIDMPDVKDINELKRLQAYYESKLRGAKKYNKWLVTGGGTTVKSTPFTPQTMQWMDSQKWFAKLIFAIFKVTPSELGFTEDLNRATGLQQMEIFKSKAIAPILGMLEEAMNREILWKYFGKELKFEFKREMSLDDRKKVADIDSIRLDKGLDSVNELRDRDGLEKWDDEKYDKPSEEGGGMEEGEDDMDWGSIFGDSSGEGEEPEDEEEEVTKGGIGSGQKGHKTYGQDVLESAKKNLTPELKSRIAELKGLGTQSEEHKKKRVQLQVDILQHGLNQQSEGDATNKNMKEKAVGGRKKEVSDKKENERKVKEFFDRNSDSVKDVEEASGGKVSSGEIQKKLQNVGAETFEQDSKKIGKGLSSSVKPANVKNFIGKFNRLVSMIVNYDPEKVGKAANVGAVSGEAGFVPIPLEYDGKPVDTKKKEKDILDIVARDYENIKRQVEEELDVLFKEQT